MNLGLDCCLTTNSASYYAVLSPQLPIIYSNVVATAANQEWQQSDG
jgi:hypothetical protein